MLLEREHPKRMQTRSEELNFDGGVKRSGSDRKEKRSEHTHIHTHTLNVCRYNIIICMWHKICSSLFNAESVEHLYNVGKMVMTREYAPGCALAGWRLLHKPVGAVT